MDFLIDQDIAVAFSLQEGGAKKKLAKRNAEGEVSRSAERDKGSSPLTSPPFEKGGRKL
jgi:hypothetical protein